jgi:hypothetical protein
MKFPYLLTDTTISVVVGKTVMTSDRSNPRWEDIKNALNDDDTTEDEMIALMKPVVIVEQAVRGHSIIEIKNGGVYVRGNLVHSTLTSRMMDILAEGLNIDPWIKFAENLFSNPVASAQNELYDFLEKSDLPITPDGCFIAYKIVRDDYKDIYSGTMDNSIGKVVELPGGRNAVDGDRNRTCSSGLHFCSKGYLGSYGTGPGNHIMIVKINPADVVAIPIDYNHAKGRTWKYEVIGELPREEAKIRQWSSIYVEDDSDWDDCDELDYDSDFYYS